MKIFYVSVIEQHSTWGAEAFVNKGFQQNGHTTITLDFRKHRNILDKKFLEVQQDFDCLFLQRGDGFPLELVKAVNRPRFFWASELVSRQSDQDRLLNSGLFSHVFMHSSACKKYVLKNRWMKEEDVTVLLNGFDPEVQHPMDKEKDIDILFVGNMLKRRKEIMADLKSQYNITVASAYGKEMTELINRSKIILNIHAEEYLDTETRLFEVLGCGGFLLSEKFSEENPFTNGVHYAEAANIDDMKSKIGYYLENSAEREQIARQGYAEAIRKHTYRHRTEEIANIFQQYITPSKSLPAINKPLVKYYGVKSGVIGTLKKIKRRLQ